MGRFSAFLAALFLALTASVATAGGPVPAGLSAPLITAVGGALKSDMPGPRIRFCSAFSGVDLLPIATPLSNGTTQTSGTDRLFFTPNTDCKNFQFLMGNGYISSGGVFNPTGNAVTFNLAMEVHNLDIVVPFGGNTGTPISTTTYSISSLSGSGTTVTATSAAANLPVTNTVFPVTVAGATPSGYNGTYNATVTGSTTFTFANTTTGASSGTITAATTGRTGVSIADGAVMLSQPAFTGVIPSGVQQAFRLHKVVSAGNHWPLNYGTLNYTYAPYKTTDPLYGTTVTDGSDQTAQYGFQTWGSFASTAYQWAPLAIIAEQVTPKPVIFISGDSIAAGLNGAKRQFGYLGYGAQNAGVAWYNAGVSSTQMGNFGTFGYLNPILSRYADYIQLNIGINDIRNTLVPDLATFQSLMIASIKTVAQPWSRIQVCTMVPLTTSSDSWTTYGGQTPLAGVSGAGSAYTREQMRVLANNWERDTTSTGLVAMANAALTNGAKMMPTCDVAAAVERNSDGSAIVEDANGQQASNTGGYWVVQPITFTGSLTSATSGTLTTPWPWASGITLIKFSNATQQNGTFINGSTAVTWGSAVSATASATTPNFAVNDGIHPLDMVYPVMAAKVDWTKFALPVQ